MTQQLLIIVNFVIEAFVNIWPYLLLTIPLAVAVQLSGASKYIDRAFQAGPWLAILLATAVGAFTPFCSCTVIPVVASLLLSGVPLAPVMSFWIASPSMDPEAFFLSVATIGWELAWWRLGGTLLLSLAAGFVTHGLTRHGWLGASILRQKQAGADLGSMFAQGWRQVRAIFSTWPVAAVVGQQPTLAPAGACCPGSEVSAGLERSAPAPAPACGLNSAGNCGQSSSSAAALEIETGQESQADPFWRQVGGESWRATVMVVKFMVLAFTLEALITLYLPEAWIAGLLGRQNSLAILWAALIGVPVYTSNLAALPLVGGLLSSGMQPGAGLAFLVAGPTTTLPAMAAVWGLASRRVFALYVAFSFVGAIILGYSYNLVAWLL